MHWLHTLHFSLCYPRPTFFPSSEQHDSKETTPHQDALNIAMGFFDNAWKALDGFGQEAGKHVGPALGETWKHLDAFGQEAGKHVGPAVGEAWKHVDAFGHGVGKHIGGAAHEAWKNADAFGQEASRNVGPVLGEAWKHVGAFGHEAGKRIGTAAVRGKEWVGEHPKETVGVVGCVLAAPIGVAVAGGVLGLAGFTATGIAAGMLPPFLTIMPGCLGLT